MVGGLLLVGQRSRHGIPVRQSLHPIHFPATRVEDVVQRLAEDGLVLYLGVVGEVRLAASGGHIGAAQGVLQVGRPGIALLQLRVILVLFLNTQI